MTIVYYNFPTINLSLSGLNNPSSKKIKLSSVGQPLTNLMLDDVNYTAGVVYIAGPKNDSPSHLIFECYSDIKDPTSNIIYFVVPLIADLNSNTTSDVDNIIEPGNRETVELTLNNYIKKNGSCFVQQQPTFPITITLDAESKIPIKSYANKNFYVSSSINNLSIHSGTDTNATLQHQDLDWIMSCELLTEDDNDKKKTPVDPSPTSTTISLFMMAIMIAGSAYLMGPIIYTESGMYKLATGVLRGNHYSINFYWAITLILLAVTCVWNGVSSNNNIYYFIAIALVLSYFGATSAIIKVPGVANQEGNAINKDPNQSIFAVYYAIFSKECYSMTGRMMKLLVFGGLIYAYLTMVGSMAMGSNTVFASHLIFFLLIAVLQLIAVLYFNKTSV